MADFGGHESNFVAHLMYRKAVAMETERQAQETFIGKVGNLPVVNSAWTQACEFYQKTKDRNSLLNATCRIAEKGVGVVATTTKPLVEKYQPQIQHVDAFACSKLAMVEKSYPIISAPTEVVLKEGRERCEAVLRPVTDRYNYYRGAYTGMVNRSKEKVDDTVQRVKDLGQKSLDSEYGKFVLEKVDEALALSEAYVEKYLPELEIEGEKEVKRPGDSENIEVPTTYTRVSALSTKLRQRMYKRAMRDLRGLQVRSQERLQKLHFTVDLIQYAKSGVHDARDMAEEKYELVQRKLVETWGRINEEPEEGEITPETLEGRTIAVARRLTFQVRQSVTVITGYLPETYQPQMVRERLEHAKQFSEDLYHSFTQAHRFEDLPAWLLSQAKEKMSYLNETVSFLSETFLVTPITWLVDLEFDITGVDFDNPEEFFNCLRVPQIPKELHAA